MHFAYNFVKMSFSAIAPEFCLCLKQFSRFRLFVKFPEQLFSRSSINDYFCGCTFVSHFYHVIISCHYCECRFCTRLMQVKGFTHGQACSHFYVLRKPLNIPHSNYYSRTDTFKKSFFDKSHKQAEQAR